MIHFEFDESIICPDDITATPERIDQYKEYYCVKYMIAKLCQPKVICEIGVRCGYSAWSFLQACPEAKYIGIDANNGKHGGKGGEDGKYFDWAKKILAGYNCEFHIIDTQTVNNLCISQAPDFFHVDGDHTYEGCLHDLRLAYKTTRTDGYILVDDYYYIEEVRSAVNKYFNFDHELIIIPSLRGEVLIRA